jgi:hypothetical protein
MDSKLEFLMKRHGVHVRLDQPIQRAAYLTKLPTHYELAVRSGLDGPELNEAVAFQLARLMLGQLERLDKDGDTKLAEWRQAIFLAARMLVPDELAMRAEQDGWDPTRLAAACGVTDMLASARLEERLFERELAPLLPDGASWDDLVRVLQELPG